MGGKFIKLLSAGVLLLSIALGLFSSYVLYTVQPPSLPEEEIKELATQFYHSALSPSDLDTREGVAADGYVDQPMVGKVVIVTGSSSGIGASLAYSMYKVCQLFTDCPARVGYNDGRMGCML